MKRLLVIFLLLAWLVPVQAAGDDVKQILTPPAKDISLEYLGVIFGKVSQGLVENGIAGNSKILGSMFEVFNQIALIVGILLVIYSVFIGTINTAASGKILGEKWSGVWLPMRSALGIALLIPTQSGYCLAQVMVMWVVYFGVGGAGTLWSSALDYLSVGGQLYSAAGVSNSEADGLDDAKATSQAIFGSMLCVKYQNERGELLARGDYGPAKVGKGSKTHINFGYLKDDNGPNNDCGSIFLDNEKQSEAILRFARDIRSLVSNYWNQRTLSGQADGIRYDVANFHDNMQKMISSGSGGSKSNGGISAYGQYGWILAGNYYREVSNFNSDGSLRVGYPSRGGSYLDAPEKCRGECAEVVKRGKKSFGETVDVAKSISYGTDNANDLRSTLKPKKPKIGGWFNTLGVGRALSGATGSIIDNMTGNFEAAGDPFANAVRMGNKMMQAAASMVVVNLIVGNIVFGMIAYICSGQNSIGHAAHNVQSIVTTLTFGMAGFLYAQGALLAIYLPLIPFVIFLFGVMGWFMSVIEAMVAAPLVALGLIWPDAQNEVLGRAEPAMMLLLNLFLRPSLMIIGLLTGMLLCWVAFKLANLGFMTMLATGGVSYEPTFGWLVLGYVYAMLLLAIAKKTFSLIHVVPDKALSWIGDQSQGHGSSEEFVGAIQGGVEKGGGAVSGGIGGFGQYLGYGGADARNIAKNIKNKVKKTKAEGSTN